MRTRHALASAALLVLLASACTPAANPPGPDRQPPVLTLPETVVVPNTGANGTVVTYVASANDSADGDVPVTCSPSSGSSFSVGVTVVTCSASDAEGNVSWGTFSVHVTAPVYDDFEDGIDLTEGWTMSPTNVVQNGRIEITTSGSIVMRCQLVGDFDASVDFTLLEGWASPTRGATLGLMTGWGGVQRSKYDTSGQGWYLNHFPPAGPSNKIATADEEGALRLKREGSTVTTFYRGTSGAWIEIGTSTGRPTTPLSLTAGAWYNGGYYNGLPFSIAFDNFIVYSVDTLDCL